MTRAGRARVIVLGDGARAPQTRNPCITGSTTEWHTRDGRMEIVIQAHRLDEAAGGRIARLTERAAGR